ncbi:PDZ and LIM domain protein 3b isoform X1 [Alosa alosa]|uniref:PDZ and LIM domain protein 3b isoform X1 n=1 Tax=Alosa alosa TaxID=278164 RepID=UPI0020150DF8|nr:PDZ and LIM domain protein 3b isoform X1 [Alosa alosa]
MPQNVVLDGPAPWGFRLMGGKDFNQPLTVSRVTPGSKASVANLCPGDIILAIDGAAAEDMTHGEAQIKIRDAGNQLTLKIERPETRLWSPAVSADDGKVNPFKINLEAEQQEYKPIGTGHNRRAQPFVAASLDDNRQVVSSSYNTPIGLYSAGNIQDALHGQIRGLANDKPEGTPAQRPMGNVVQGGSNPPQPVTQPVANPGPNQFMAPTDQYNSPIALYSEANVASAQQQAQMSAGEENSSPSGKMLSSIEDSHVYRMLQDNQEPTHEPRQSGSFRALQDYIDSDGSRPLVTRSVRAPVTKPSQAASTLSKLPLCDKCGQGIVGTVVKARDKFRHPACFVCSDCDINLKQKGYFFVEGQLYCEMHARVRTAPVDGHDLIAVFPSS